jgi:3-oxoacyl-[acyl-carrier protein] reductase
VDLGLADKRCVVLASTAGLGRACAEALLAEGARVSISGRDPARLASALGELEARFGERVRGARLDVTDAAAVERHFADARAAFGPVEVLVTNAGGPAPGPASEVDDAGWRDAFELSALTAMRAIWLALPDMRAARFGRIVALTSLSVRQPIAGLARSNAARAALTGYLKTLADEVAPDGVLVSSVQSGLFATERLESLLASRAAKSGRTLEDERRAALAGVPVGRFGDPAELGALVAFLCSERCSFLTGAALPLDGGAHRGLQ